MGSTLMPNPADTAAWMPVRLWLPKAWRQGRPAVEQAHRPQPVDAAGRKQHQRQRPVFGLEARTGGPHQRLGPGRNAIAAAGLALQQRDVDLAAGQPALQLAAHAADGLEPQIGPLAIEAGQHRRHAPCVEILRNAQAQRGLCGRAGHRLFGLLRHRQQATRVVGQQLAVRGRLGLLAAAVALQQRAADALFELEDLLAHRRLRAVHPLGTAREAAFLDDANQGFEEFEIEHWHILLATIFDLKI